MRTIAHVSDFHFGAELPWVAEALRADLARISPSLTVVSGDLTQRARRRQFAEARAFLEKLPGPRLVVPGNHDVPLYDVFRRMFAPLARYRKFIGADLDPVFDDGELFVAGVNTARALSWESGRISVSQINALRHELGRTQARFKVVVTHHPFIPPPAGSASARIDLVGRARRALVVLDAGSVDLLLSGHLHRSYGGDARTRTPASRRAIVAAQAGTAISRRLRARDPNSYNLISLDEDMISVEVRTWSDDRFVSLRTARFVRAEQGWIAAGGA